MNGGYIMNLKVSLITYLIIVSLTGFVLTGHAQDKNDEAIKSYDDTSERLGKIISKPLPMVLKHNAAERLYKKALRIYEGIKEKDDLLDIWTLQLCEQKEREFLLQQELKEELAQKEILKHKIVKDAIKLDSQSRKGDAKVTAQSMLYEQYTQQQALNAQQIAVLEKELAYVRSEIERIKGQIETNYGVDADTLAPDIQDVSIYPKELRKPGERKASSVTVETSGIIPTAEMIQSNAYMLEQLKNGELEKRFSKLVQPKLRPVFDIPQDSFSTFLRHSARNSGQ